LKGIHVPTISRADEVAASLDATEAMRINRLKIGAMSMIVLLLLAGAYFTPHIWQHGEAREALVIQDIVKNQRWVLPLRNGELPSKPVLYHWLGASFGLLAGLSDFTIRLPSVLGAALMVWITYSVAALGAQRKTGLLAVGILVSTFQFWDSGTEARVDMIFAACVVAALAAWYFWYRLGREIARAATYLAVALAVLAKGPAGAVLPALAIGAFLLFRRELSTLRRSFSWPWFLAVLVLDLGWYLAAYERAGAAFWHKQIMYENLNRFFGWAEFRSQKNSFSQAIWLMTHLFPWSLVLLAAPLRWLRGQREDSFGHFLHAWWMTIFVFFLFAAGQRPVYLLPIYPAVALLVARECAAFFDAEQKSGAKPRLWFARWGGAARVVAIFGLVLALAIPISRTVQEDSSEQEAFVEAITGKLAGVPAALYAAPNFPSTALIVLAYRLKRNIRSRPLPCRGEYYYLTTGNLAASCAPKIVSTVSHAYRGGNLQLLHVANGG
jgi:4-amino-4-deoxy-L-arabinose transferase-like glycosyltransferase